MTCPQFMQCPHKGNPAIDAPYFWPHALAATAPLDVKFEAQNCDKQNENE